VKTGSQDYAVSTMSGSNQQKVVLVKWLATAPKLLIVDEPTRGLDVGTKAELHRLLSDLAGRGIAIIMISSELPEVLGVADRILVMHEGRISAEFSTAEATAELVMHAATSAEGGDAMTAVRPVHEEASGATSAVHWFLRARLCGDRRRRR
jgi:rhamnose transport system ATP-binding protein